MHLENLCLCRFLIKETQMFFFAFSPLIRNFGYAEDRMRLDNKRKKSVFSLYSARLWINFSHSKKKMFLFAHLIEIFTIFANKLAKMLTLTAVFLCRDSAKRASTMALAAPSVQHNWSKLHSALAHSHLCRLET